MKEKDRNSLITWIENLNIFPMRFDGRDFYKRIAYESISVWERLEAGDVVQEIRQLLPDSMNAAEAAKWVREEIKSNPQFRCQKTGIKNKEEVITLQGRLNLKTLELNAVEDDENIYRFANFHYLPQATWQEAPYFTDYVRTSLGIDLLNSNDSAQGKKQLLLQILVYMCTELWGAKKAVVLLGPASSGKTVLLDLLRAVIGEKRYTALSLADLSDRFRGALIDTACIIINDEIGASIKNLDYVKKVISGEPVVVERKNGTPYTCQPNIKVCVAANALPLVLERDGEGAFSKRLQILQFLHAIPAEQWVLDLSEKIIAERDVIMSCAIRESADFIAKPIFTDDEDGAKLLEMYQRENDSVKAFLYDSEVCKLGADEICLAEDFRSAYYAYCEAEGLPPIKKGLNLWLQQYGIRQERTRGDKYRNPRSHYRGVSLVRL